MNTLKTSKFDENCLVISPTDLERDVRHLLVKIGVSHATLIISSDVSRDSVVFKYIDGLDDQTDISNDINLNIEYYLKLGAEQKEQKLVHEYDTRFSVKRFCNDSLMIHDSMMHNYLYRNPIDYGYSMQLMFHAKRALSQASLSQLRIVTNVIESWSKSWIAHHKMLDYWNSINFNKHTVNLLTQSEYQVLSLLVKGMTGSEISRHRNVSKETVRSQIKSILRKTNCKSQNKLISVFGFGQWLSKAPTVLNSDVTLKHSSFEVS